MILISVQLLSIWLQVKIELPTQLHEKHHILFSFFHVTCDINAKAHAKKEALETSGTDGSSLRELYVSSVGLGLESILQALIYSIFLVKFCIHK